MKGRTLKNDTTKIWDVLTPEQRRAILKLKDRLAFAEKRP